MLSILKQPVQLSEEDGVWGRKCKVGICYFGAQSPFGDTIVPGTRYQALTVGNYNTIISMLLHPRPYAHAVI